MLNSALQKSQLRKFSATKIEYWVRRAAYENQISFPHIHLPPLKTLDEVI